MSGLRDEIADQIHYALPTHDGRRCAYTCNRAANAVAAFVQPELDQRDTEIEKLRAKVAHHKEVEDAALKGWKHESERAGTAEAERNQLKAELRLRDEIAERVKHDLNGQVADAIASLGIEWETDHTQDHLVAELSAHVGAGLEAARIEGDQLIATIARVRARLDELIAYGFGARHDGLEDLRALLDQPEATPTPSLLPVAPRTGSNTCSCDGDPIECTHEAHRAQTEAELIELKAVVRRISQLADAWEGRFPGKVNTDAVVSAIRATTERVALDQHACDCQAGIIEFGCPTCDHHGIDMKIIIYKVVGGYQARGHPGIYPTQDEAAEAFWASQQPVSELESVLGNPDQDESPT